MLKSSVEKRPFRSVTKRNQLPGRHLGGQGHTAVFGNQRKGLFSLASLSGPEPSPGFLSSHRIVRFLLSLQTLPGTQRRKDETDADSYSGTLSP